jgi:hypothetical protein
MDALFDGIPLDEVTTSMTVNCSASIILAMYFAVAERRGIPMSKLGGTIQNDMLKEYIAQKEWISPPVPSVRVIVDMIEFCTQQAPRFHPVSISGYHIREAGSTRCRRSRSRSPTGSATSSGGRAGPRGRRLRAAALVLLQPPQRLPRRRSPSCAPRAACGRASCATASARRTRAR